MWNEQSDDAAFVSLHELGRMCRESLQFCKTNTTLIWPLSWQGMVHTFTKTYDTVAAFDISYFKTVKTITMNNNQCHAQQSFLRSHQLLSYSFNSLSSTQHVSSLLFSPQPHSHPLTHLVLTYILHWTTSPLQPPCSVHFKHNADTPNWETKKLRHPQIKQSLIQCTNLKLTQATPDEAPTSYLTWLIPNYVIKFEQQNINDNNKQKPLQNNKHNTHTITKKKPTQ